MSDTIELHARLITEAALAESTTRGLDADGATQAVLLEAASGRPLRPDAVPAFLRGLGAAALADLGESRRALKKKKAAELSVVEARSRIGRFIENERAMPLVDRQDHEEPVDRNDHSFSIPENLANYGSENDQQHVAEDTDEDNGADEMGPSVRDRAMDPLLSSSIAALESRLAAYRA